MPHQVCTHTAVTAPVLLYGDCSDCRQVRVPSRVYRCSSAFRGRRASHLRISQSLGTHDAGEQVPCRMYPDRDCQSLIPIYDRDRCNPIITTTLARSHRALTHTHA